MKMDTLLENFISNPLLENNTEYSTDLVVKYLKKNCQAAISFCNDKNLRLYRGVKDHDIDSYSIDDVIDNSKIFMKRIRTYTARKPLDSSKIAHNMFNRGLSQFGGIKWRSASIFCTMNENIASEYGYPAVIMPIGDFKILQSKDVADMYSRLDPDSAGFNIIWKMFDDGISSKITNKKLIELIINLDEYKTLVNNMADILINSIKIKSKEPELTPTNLKNMFVKFATNPTSETDMEWIANFIICAGKLNFGLYWEPDTYDLDEASLPFRNLLNYIRRYDANAFNDIISQHKKEPLHMSCLRKLVFKKENKQLMIEMYLKVMDIYFANSMTFIDNPTSHNIKDLDRENEIMVSCEKYYMFRAHEFNEVIAPKLFG